MKTKAFFKRIMIGGIFLIIIYFIGPVNGYSTPQMVGTGGNDVLVGDGRLWFVPKEGASWKKGIPSQAKQGRIESLATDPNDQRRLLLCQGGVVWMSKDKGFTWGLPIFEYAQEQGVAAAFHPKEPNKLLLATNQRLLISNNAGKNWTTPTAGLDFKWRPLAILTSVNKPDRMYVMTRGEGVYRSSDTGNTWTAANSGLPKGIGAAPVASIESAVLDPTNPDVAYVAAEAMGIFKTNDGGKIWFRANKGLPDTITHRTSPWVLTIDALNSQRLLVWASWPVNSVRTDTEFFLSKDGAKSWHKIDAGPDRGRVFAIQFENSEDNMAVAITESGVTLLPN